MGSVFLPMIPMLHFLSLGLEIMISMTSLLSSQLELITLSGLGHLNDLLMMEQKQGCSSTQENKHTGVR